MNELVQRLSRDLAAASATLSDAEARFLVAAYYTMQEHRKRTGNQVLALATEPHSVLLWLNEQSETLEGQIKRALNRYTDSRPIGLWLKSVYGIGPVIAAGLLAHIDITKAPTVGHIWRYAGLDPTSKWEKGHKRPWNAELKTLCWKIGQSFLKFYKQEECYYGQLYDSRKSYEIERNEAGGNAEVAAEILRTKKIGKETETFKYLIAGKLSPAHIDARARRYAVKFFLSHLQIVWWFIQFGELPPKPYVLSHLEHAHFKHPWNTDSVPGLTQALAAWAG